MVDFGAGKRSLCDMRSSPSLPSDRSRVLETFLDGVAAASGLRISVCDLDYFTAEVEGAGLPRRLQVHCSDFCAFVKESPQAFQRCRAVENEKALLVRSKPHGHLHQCYAGVIDLVVPILRGNQLIGAICFGQGALAEDSSVTDQRLEALAKRYGFELKKLKRAHATLPKISRRDLLRWRDVIIGVKHFIEQQEELFLWKGQADDSKGLQQHTNASPTFLSGIPNLFLESLRPQSVPIQKALALVKAAYWKSPSHAAVARQVGLSEGQFSRRFSGELGVTYRRVLAFSKVWMAGWLVKKTDFSMAQISDLLGYEDHSSFVRAFKQHTGCTPKEFVRSRGQIYHAPNR